MARVFLNKAAVQQMFDAGGQVWVEVGRKATRVLARAEAMAPRRTGALARSLRKMTVVRPLGIDVFIGSDLPYAASVHSGSVAHEILPRNGRVLAFTYDGRKVFARRVDHPGTKGDPFLRRAVEEEFGIVL